MLVNLPPFPIRSFKHEGATFFFVPDKELVGWHGLYNAALASPPEVYVAYGKTQAITARELSFFEHELLPGALLSLQGTRANEGTSHSLHVWHALRNDDGCYTVEGLWGLCNGFYHLQVGYPLLFMPETAEVLLRQYPDLAHAFTQAIKEQLHGQKNLTETR